jgi:allantoinase
MPLNSIPATTSLAALETKAAAVAPHAHIDHAFWGGVVPGNLAELEPMIDAGVAGFKSFMCPSGVDEFENVTEKDLDAALPVLARRGVPLIVHAELEGEAPPFGDEHAYASYLASRPRRWENEAVRQLIGLSRRHGAAIHVVHLSSSDALVDLKAAQAEGVRISAETCPHYLTFTSEEISQGATQFKCAPPIREEANREALWAGLLGGVISMVVSDHSPCTPALKHLAAGDFKAAWGGISSLQLSLSAVWTGLSARGGNLLQLSTWMSQRTAQLTGLSGKKGSIAVGLDADLVVFDPEATFTVKGEALEHRHKVTPYAGRVLKGLVDATYLRGEPIHMSRQFHATHAGQRVRRPAR